MKRYVALFAAIVVVSFAVSACSKSQDNSSSSETSTSGTMAAESAAPAQPMASVASKMPIPLAKLPVQAVAAGNAGAGSQVFAAQCASCHGEGGKNGSVGPTLAGAGLKAGQVAYMVRHPQGIDKDSSMPPLPLTDKQLADVAAYVASLK